MACVLADHLLRHEGVYWGKGSGPLADEAL